MDNQITAMRNDNIPKIIFISGTGRSGTNILKKIFAQNSAVSAMPFEYRFIIDPNGIIDFYNSIKYSWSPFLFDSKLRQLQSYLRLVSGKKLSGAIADKLLRSYDKSGLTITPAAYSQWELDKWLPDFKSESEKLIRNLAAFKYRGAWPGAESYSIKNEIYFGEFTESIAPVIRNYIYKLIQNYLSKTGGSVFVEDNTWNILYAKEMFELFPESKLIHIFRDPRDVISSLVRQRWAPNNIVQATRFYKSIINKWHDQRTKIPAEYYTEFRFENLIGNTREQLIRMCDFVDLPLEESMLEVDLSRANIGRWKSNLTETEQKQVLVELSDEIYESYFYNK